MLAQKLENFCARADFCVSITIDLSSTCRVAKFEIKAFNFAFHLYIP